MKLRKRNLKVLYMFGLCVLAYVLLLLVGVSVLTALFLNAKIPFALLRWFRFPLTYICALLAFVVTTLGKCENRTVLAMSLAGSVIALQAGITLLFCREVTSEFYINAVAFSLAAITVILFGIKTGRRCRKRNTAAR